MSETQEPYGEEQPEPSAAEMLAEIVPEVEQGRKDLVEIAMGMTGQIEPVELHCSAMRLRAIADVFSMAAHLDMMATCDQLIAQRDEAKGGTE